MEPRRVYELRATVYRVGRRHRAEVTLARARDDDTAVGYEGWAEASGAHTAIQRAFLDARAWMRRHETA